MGFPEDSPAAIASLSVIRETLVALRDKGILTSNEIVTAINRVDPGITADNDFDKMVYKACLWLKTPHLAESLIRSAPKPVGKNRRWSLRRAMFYGFLLMLVVFAVHILGLWAGTQQADPWLDSNLPLHMLLPYWIAYFLASPLIFAAVTLIHNLIVRSK